MIQFIGISGKLCSGKTTVSEHLIRHYGYKRVSLATPIKNIGKCLINYMQEMEKHKHNPYKTLDIATTAANELDLMLQDVILSVEPYNSWPISSKHAIVTQAKNALIIRMMPQFRNADWSLEKNESIRHLYQAIGEVLREVVDDGIWVKYMLNNIRQSYNGVDKFVCDDLRHKSEFEPMKKFGFTTIRLQISPEEQLRRVHALYGKIDPQRFQHISEINLDDMIDHFDLVINANNPLEEVLGAVDNFIKGEDQ